MADVGLAGTERVGVGHGNGHGPGPRPLTRRRSLPNGRAVAGGVLVAAAAVGLFSISSRAGTGARHPYVVARQAVPVGARLQASDLTLRPMDLPPQVRSRAFDRPSALVGATTVAPLAAGELVQASAVVSRPADSASREVSFPLEVNRLPSGIKEGERLDLVATYGTSDEALTAIVVPQTLVVSLERGRGSLGQAATVVTVALESPEDVLALSHALQLGKLTAVRATGAPPVSLTLPYRPPGAVPSPQPDDSP